MWHALVDANLSGDGFILAGDFNMVKSLDDYMDYSPKCTSPTRWEKAAWSRLLNHYGLEDVWRSEHIRKTSHKSFTWSNNRSGEAYWCARIGRIYLSCSLTVQGGNTCLHSHTKILDYAPVTFRLFPSASIAKACKLSHRNIGVCKRTVQLREGLELRRRTGSQ